MINVPRLISSVSFIFTLYITTSTIVHATQCCFHGPLKNRSRTCSTVSTQAECDQKTKAVVAGIETPNKLMPGIESGTGLCTSDTVCCSGSTRSSSIDLNSDETCSEDILLVELSSFIAKPTNDGVLLNWTTKAELDSQGFKMWRAIPKLNSYCGCSKKIEDYIQIQVLDKKGKPVFIPAEGNTTSGHDYSYLDKDTKPGIAYCYALEDIDSKGKSKFYFEYVAFTQDNLEETK